MSDPKNIIYGTSASETLNGTAGDDDILSGGGNDYILAGAGDDYVNSTLNGNYLYSGSVIVYGGTGNDKISGTSGNDKIYGEDGADTLFGFYGDDTLDGGDGDDIMSDGLGNDTLRGGAGNDLFINYGNTDTFDGGDGTDKLFTKLDDEYIASIGLTEKQFVVGLNLETGKHGQFDMTNLQFTGVGLDTLISIEDFEIDGNFDIYAIGDSNANTITGDEGDDTIKGGAGDDKLYGGDGDDTIYGGFGDNVLAGGLDNDTYFYAYQSTDTVSDSGGSNDTLYVTSRDVDNVGYFGDSYVQNGDLVLVSRQDSSKSLTVGNAFTADGRIENITFHADSGAWEDLDYRISSLEDNFTGENIMYFGTRSDDLLVMNDGYNDAVLSAGNDTVTMGDGGGWVLSGDGDDIVTGGDGNDNILGEAGDDTLEGGAGNDTLYGGNNNDKLYGGSGKDTLEGGDGRDYMYAGNDSDRDIFIFRDIDETVKGSQRDRIFGFDSGEDDIHLRTIDANEDLAGDQNFSFSSDGAAANSVWVKDFGSSVLVRGDVNGDKIHDFEIFVASVDDLYVYDFIL